MNDGKNIVSADLPILGRPSRTAAGAATAANNSALAYNATQPALTTLDRIASLADAGNASAQLMIGLRYLGTEKGPARYAQAAKWLQLAATNGEALAQYRLGTLYAGGYGVPADAAKALYWYEAAAKAGNRKAMYNLAVAYTQGTGAAKNPTEAARWFSKAADMGLVDAQFDLAVLYERGNGVPQSLLDAYRWYAIAAKQGDQESKERIDALSTQISADARAAAETAVAQFKNVPLDPRANTAPQPGSIL
jgi:localization factor PodJL